MIQEESLFIYHSARKLADLIERNHHDRAEAAILFWESMAIAPFMYHGDSRPYGVSDMAKKILIAKGLYKTK
jgi:hypothetical protein